MNKFLKEPLFHFLAIGLALFVTYANMNDENEIISENTLHVSKLDIEKINQFFIDGRGREPDEKEKKELLDKFIEDEILYLEALKKGLDKNDNTIKKHLRKKMKFVLDDLNMVEKPTNKDLEEYLQNNGDLFKEEDTISYNQVMFTRKNDKTNVRENSLKFLKALRSKDSSKVAHIGDLINSSEHKLEKTLGHEFGDEIFHTTLKKWMGPFATKYGYHLVYVHKIKLGQIPKLSDIKDKVEAKYMRAKQDEANKIFYKKLQGTYEIIIN